MGLKRQIEDAEKFMASCPAWMMTDTYSYYQCIIRKPKMYPVSEIKTKEE